MQQILSIQLKVEQIWLKGKLAQKIFKLLSFFAELTFSTQLIFTKSIQITEVKTYPMEQHNFKNANNGATCLRVIQKSAYRGQL